MYPSTISSNLPTTPPSSNCCPDQDYSPWLKRVDLVCRLAIATFSSLIAPLHFAASCALGSLVGAVYAVVKWIKNTSLIGEENAKPICAQGYMIFLSGTRFPPLVNTLATGAFIAAHVRHDPSFYVPFCGLFFGFWIGKNGVDTLRDLSGRTFSYFNQSQSTSQPTKCCCG